MSGRTMRPVERRRGEQIASIDDVARSHRSRDCDILVNETADKILTKKKIASSSITLSDFLQIRAWPPSA